MSTATGEVKAGRAYVEILLNQTPLERGLNALSPWDWTVLVDVIGVNVYRYYSRH